MFLTLEPAYQGEDRQELVAVEDAVLVGVVEGLRGLDAEAGDGAEVFAGGVGGEGGSSGVERGEKGLFVALGFNIDSSAPPVPRRRLYF
jgi:hypothetical protein